MEFVFRALGPPAESQSCESIVVHFPMALNFHSQKQIHLNSQSKRERERERGRVRERESFTANKRFNEISLQIGLALDAELQTNQHFLEQATPWLRVGGAGRRVLTAGWAQSERVPGRFHFSHGRSGVFFSPPPRCMPVHISFLIIAPTPFICVPLVRPELLCNKKIAHTLSLPP